MEGTSLPHVRHWVENLSLHLNSVDPTGSFSLPSSDPLPWDDDPTNVSLEVCPGRANVTRPGVDPAVFIYVSIFLIVLCTVSLAVNVVILSSVCFMRSSCKPTLYISLSLAGADTFSLFLFASGLLFFTLLPRLGHSFDAPCAKLMLEALRMGAIMTTLFHLAALAGNHYLGIQQPLRYPVYMARRNIQYGIVVLWTVPPSLLVLDMFFLEGDGFNKCPYEFLMRSKFRTRFSTPFFATLGMMIFIYLHIYKVVCKHIKKPIDGKHQRHYSRSRENEKAIVTTMMILGSTIFGWMPAFTHFALFCEDCALCRYWNMKTPGEAVLIVVINLLMICKTATNSYIYAFRMKEIKKALRRMRRRLLTRLCAAGDLDYEDCTERGLTRTTSRQSTSRSRTLVCRMNSLQDSPVNGLSHSPAESLRRCRSARLSRHKRCSTSV